MTEIEQWLEGRYWRLWSLTDADDCSPWEVGPGVDSKRFPVGEKHNARPGRTRGQDVGHAHSRVHLRWQVHPHA